MHPQLVLVGNCRMLAIHPQRIAFHLPVCLVMIVAPFGLVIIIYLVWYPDAFLFGRFILC